MTPPTIGELNPELAKKFGLDPYQAGTLSEEMKRWEGRVLPVTFVEAPPRADGKRDPIGYLPPSYRTYGVVDRDHRHRVNVGETWIVEVTERSVGALFLTPLFRLDLKNLLELQPERLQQVAEFLAHRSPELAKELASKLPPAPQPALEKELVEAKRLAAGLQTRLEDLQKEKTSLETQLGQLTAQKQTAPSVSPPQPVAGPGPEPRRLGPAEGPTAAGAHEGGILHRVEGDVVESAELVHPAYDVHFTGDLYRVVLRPSRTGVPCAGGRMVVRGLSRVDPNPPPTSYSMVWDDRLSEFVAYVGQARAQAESGQT